MRLSAGVSRLPPIKQINIANYMEYLHDITRNHAVFFSAAILVLAYILIASEKISKVTIALIGACAAIILGLMAQEKSTNGVANPTYYINYIDFNVVFLLIAMMIIVSVAARSGIFNFAAAKLLRLTHGIPMLILPTLAVFTAVVSAFLDNVTTVILVMPITFAISKKLGIPAVPFLVAEIFASNIGGTATLIGDPPNIIIGSAANLSFMDFICELSPIVAIIMVVVCGYLLFVFRKDLKASKERMDALMHGNRAPTITDRACAVRSILVLVCVIVGFGLHDALELQTSTIALTGASILLLFEKPEDLFRDVEWNTIFFFIGLFIIVGALEASGGIKIMADWILEVTKGSQSATAMIILWGSGVISGIIDNIPYTATMTPLILEIEKSMGAAYAHPLWWSLSLGACLGGNMTIIGAAANVIVSENSAKHGHKIAFLEFFKYGFVVMVISLAVSSVSLWIKYFS